MSRTEPPGTAIEKRFSECSQSCCSSALCRMQSACVWKRLVSITTSLCEGSNENKQACQCRAFLTSRLSAKFSMSLSVIVVGSSSSLLASAAGDSIASKPRNASAYAVFMLTLSLRLRKLEMKVATCKLVFEPKLINRYEVPRVTELYESRFS